MEAMKWIFLTAAIAGSASLPAQDLESRNSERICLAVTCGDLGFTQCFEDSDQMMTYLFMSGVDLVTNKKKLKGLSKTEIEAEYPGMEKYCNRLFKVRIKKKQFPKT